jgi:hypothetical protein
MLVGLATRFMAGRFPYPCSIFSRPRSGGCQNLADLGAEVVKIERPGVGDDSRAFGPPWVKDASGRDTKDSAYFTSANRGKKSITLNISAPEGQAIARELARKSDVLLENYKYGDLARYGQAMRLKRSIPDCLLLGDRLARPAPSRAARLRFHDPGMGGMMSVTGEPDSLPGGGPRAPACRSPTSSPACTPVAICAALANLRTGRGQHRPARSIRRSRCSYQNTNYFSLASRRSASATLHLTSSPITFPHQRRRRDPPAATTTCSASFAKPQGARGSPRIRDSRPTASGWRTAWS